MTTINFKITNVDCDACIKLSTKELKELPGVQTVRIAPDGVGVVEAEGITFEQIQNALTSVGKNSISI